MRKISFVFILGFTFLFFSADDFCQTAALPRNDFQIWNETSVAFPLLRAKDKKGKEFDRLTVFLTGTLRFGRNALRPVDERIGFGFNYRLNKYVSFTPEYLYRDSQSPAGVSQFEHLIRFAVTPENKWKRFSLSDRNMIEYRVRHSRQDSARYRNRLRFEYPLKKTGREIFTPFVSNEPFYDFLEQRLTRDEFFAGINKKFSGNFSADFFYLFLKDRGFPKAVNGFGINLRFKSNRFIK